MTDGVALSREDNDRLIASVNIVRRTGATEFEFGHLDDTPSIADARWWAKALYRGARITVEDHVGPIEAAEALAYRLLQGGRCAWCGNAVILDGVPADVTGVRLADGSALGVCRWQRTGSRWDRTCTATARVLKVTGPGDVAGTAEDWARQLDGATAIRGNRASRRRNAKRNARRRGDR